MKFGEKENRYKNSFRHDFKNSWKLYQNLPKSYAVKGNKGPIGVVVEVVVGNTNDGGWEVVVEAAEAVGKGPEL